MSAMPHGSRSRILVRALIVMSQQAARGLKLPILRGTRGSFEARRRLLQAVEPNSTLRVYDR